MFPYSFLKFSYVEMPGHFAQYQITSFHDENEEKDEDLYWFDCNTYNLY